MKIGNARCSNYLYSHLSKKKWGGVGATTVIDWYGSGSIFWWTTNDMQASFYMSELIFLKNVAGQVCTMVVS